MSKLNIKQAFISHLRSNLPTGITDNDFAFDNAKFDPSGKTAWLAAYFLGGDSEPLGKTSRGFNDERGLFQISVFVELNGVDPDSNQLQFDNTQLQIIDDLESAFSYNTELVYNDQKIYITSIETTAGTQSEAWFKRDITINYFSLSERGSNIEVSEDREWQETQKLTASDGAENDSFVIGIAMSDERIVVGWFSWDDNGNDSGAAYVYDLEDGVWQETQKLTASDGAVNNSFGIGIAMSDERIVVGAYLDNDNGNNSGSAYVYDLEYK